jgi:hypothetical protein
MHLANTVVFGTTQVLLDHNAPERVNKFRKTIATSSTSGDGLFWILGLLRHNEGTKDNGRPYLYNRASFVIS